MMDDNFNLIESTIRLDKHNLFLELDDGSRLFLPKSQQEKLHHYVDQKVDFGIRPDFISIAAENDQLNTIHGKLTSLETKDGFQLVHFKIAHKEMISRLRYSALAACDIGQSLRFNFDTFFSHIFDQDTQVNLTI